jgi:hypothetical protein
MGCSSAPRTRSAGTMRRILPVITDLARKKTALFAYMVFMQVPMYVGLRSPAQWKPDLQSLSVLQCFTVAECFTRAAEPGSDDATRIAKTANPDATRRHVMVASLHKGFRHHGMPTTKNKSTARGRGGDTIFYTP